MSALLSLVYVSSARVPLDEPALERLLQSARIRNQQDGLTGVLLYHDGNFIQYLEGPAVTVNQTYRRIARDPVHGNLIELLLEPITERSFTGWDMGFVRPTASEMLALSTARWKQADGAASANANAPEGIQLLHSFWQTAQR
nr:BLUF domain-containing protein [uncultured Albidiferax sp.]